MNTTKQNAYETVKDNLMPMLNNHDSITIGWHRDGGYLIKHVSVDTSWAYNNTVQRLFSEYLKDNQESIIADVKKRALAELEHLRKEAIAEAIENIQERGDK